MAAKKQASKKVPAVVESKPDPIITAITSGARKPGRVSGVLARVAELLSAETGATVKAVAAATEVSERDVRLAIDTIRRKGGYESVKRLSPGTFKYVGSPAAAE